MTYLYLIGPDVPLPKVLKIGVAVDVNKRIKDLQIGSPQKLKVFAAWRYPNKEKARGAERIAHYHFRNENSHGEWYAITIPDMHAFMQRDLNMDKLIYPIHVWWDATPGELVKDLRNVRAHKKSTTERLFAPPRPRRNDSEVVPLSLPATKTEKKMGLPDDSPLLSKIVQHYREHHLATA